MTAQQPIPLRADPAALRQAERRSLVRACAALVLGNKPGVHPERIIKTWGDDAMAAAIHARLRHDGCHPTSGQQAHAQKNQVERNAKTSDLIPWSIQEIRRIAQRLARKRIQPADVIAWSLWRRAHQAAAQKSHLKQKSQL